MRGVAFVLDLSERRRLEALQRQFVASVSHELRNPVAGIRGVAQLLRRRGAYDATAVETIVAQTRHLERLIDDLLTASRLETGRLDLRRAPTDLVALAAAAADEARAASARHPVRVEAPAGPLVGVWDGDRLAQVLRNLLGNAVKYSPDGGEIVVRVAAHGPTAEVAVTDHGAGVGPAELPRLFDRFYRAGTVAAEVPGLGLGLAIAKELVEAHGGRLWAESAGPGRGSTFRLALPWPPPRPRAAREKRAAPPAAAAAAGGAGTEPAGGLSPE